MADNKKVYVYGVWIEGPGDKPGRWLKGDDNTKPWRGCVREAKYLAGERNRIWYPTRYTVKLVEDDTPDI